MFRSRLHLCSSSSNQKSTENAFKAALNNLQNKQQQHPQRDTRKSQYSKSFSNHKHRPSNTSNNQHNQLDSFIQAFSNKQHQNSSGSSSTGSSLINRLKDNLLQQRWANSLSLFDNTSDEVKSAKWKPFHIAPILEVNRKHNRSVDSRREQFEKVWSYMKKYPQQSMDVFSLSEALATACQVREPKPLVEEVKNAISENNYNVSLTLSDGDEQQRNSSNIQHQEEIRTFAKRIYRNYIASDWESALASVDKFVELVCGVQQQQKQQQPQEIETNSVNNTTQNTAVVDDDDLEDLDEAAAEAKLAALAAASSEKKKTMINNNNNNNNKFTALNNIHTFLYHVEDPQALRNTLNFLSQNRNSSSSSSLLPQPTEQTWASLIHCHGRKGDWESAIQVLEEMKTNYEQQHQDNSTSNIIIIPRPGPHCYSQVLKSLSKYQSASRTENFVELLQLCEKIVEEMTESQIPHTPDVVEAVVGVFEARQAVHHPNFPTKQSPETKSPETDSSNTTTTNLQEWKSTAWYEALSYFSAIKTSTNAKGTRRTYDSLIKMYERRSTDIRDAGKTAQDIYAAMREDGLQPDEQSQVKLINSWSFKKAREIRRKF